MNKELWLKAYEQTLKEYEENNHDFDDLCCQKCILANRIERINKQLPPYCEECPENIFKGASFIPGCRFRKVSAMSSNWLSTHHKLLLIEYHKQAIEVLQKMEKWNLEEFQNELVKIDKKL